MSRGEIKKRGVTQRQKRYKTIMEECVQTTRATQRDMKETVRVITGTKPASAAFKKKYNKKKNIHRRTEIKAAEQKSTTEHSTGSLSLSSLSSFTLLLRGVKVLNGVPCYAISAVKLLKK